MDPEKYGITLIPEYLKKTKTFKIILVGDATTGKTSWVRGICSEEFKPDYIQSKDIWTSLLSFKTSKGWIKVKIWDIPATKKHDSNPSHYSNTDAVIFFIDTSSKNSWEESMVSWYKDISRVTGDLRQKSRAARLLTPSKDPTVAATETEDSFMGIPQVTVFNKSDLYTCLIKPGSENDCFLISVKDNSNIFKPIHAILKMLLDDDDLELLSSMEVEK